MKQNAKLDTKGLTKDLRERTDFMEIETDQIVDTSNNIILQETYFNQINNLIASDVFLERSNETENSLYNRRICLENIFEQRALFLLDEKLRLFKNYLNQYGIISNIKAMDIFKADYRLFKLSTYKKYIDNPISAGDCALVVNSIIFNNIMQFRETSRIGIGDSDGLSYNELFNITNNLLNVFLFDLVHLFNRLYFEANEVYIPAGSGVPPKKETILEGEERIQALKDMGREDLIDTDIKVGILKDE